MFTTINQLQETTKVIFDSDSGIVLDEKKLKDSVIDQLIFSAVFGQDDIKKEARKTIRLLAKALGVYPASIFAFYKAIGDGKVSNSFTVPAFNLRTLIYDIACLIFHIAMQKKTGPFIFEIARSEMTYTQQRPEEYATCILAAAIKEGYKGPIFLQADHCQINAKRFLENPYEELETMKKLISEALSAQFYNIDIDASTLVDLTKESISQQQKSNYEVSAQLTQYIREIQPKNIIVSVGAEIGHIGGKNSTPEELTAFMQGFVPLLGSVLGITKISVQTGTSHGGTPLPDGTIAVVKLDFTVLETIGRLAKAQYHLGGTVQHGASTLPLSLFDQFPKYTTLEIHLATAFQNIVYDTMPKNLQELLYAWVRKTLQSERGSDWSDGQFIYKLRKKALGPFKKTLWSLPREEKTPILQALTKHIETIFDKLNLSNTKDTLNPYVT